MKGGLCGSYIPLFMYVLFHYYDNVNVSHVLCCFIIVSWNKSFKRLWFCLFIRLASSLIMYDQNI